MEARDAIEETASWLAGLAETLIALAESPSVPESALEFLGEAARAKAVELRGA